MLLIIVSLGTNAGALAQTPDPSSEADPLLPDGPLGEQIGSVIDAAIGDVSLTNPDEIVSHFDPGYLDAMGIEGLIEFAYGLVRTWAPVTFELIEVNDDGTSGSALLIAQDGTLLDLDIAIDPETALITDVAVQPAVSGTTAASPAPSPAEGFPVPDFAEIEPQ